MMEPFSYEPLSSLTKIRLLKVTLSKSFQLHCELTEIELSEEYSPAEAPPKYTALSYTWGDSSSTVPLICNGKRLDITTNLAEALEMAVEANPHEFLWVDQISINQRDNEEKAVQVRKMTHIYDRAQSVLAWIGPGRRDTKLAVDWIKRVAGLTKGFGNDIFRDSENSDERKKIETYEAITHEQSEKLGVSFHNDAAWWAFSSFYDSPWFQRIWIVQEVLPAREAWITCGDHSVEWHHVKAAAAWYTFKAGLIRERYDPTRVVDGIAYSRAMNLSWRMRWGSEFLPDLLGQTVRATYTWAFDELLTTFRNRLAGDPRDKIYALLGISTIFSEANTPLMRPDYNKSVMEVYRDAIRGLIKHESTHRSALHILLNAAPHTDEPGWPSWVPDWRITEVRGVGAPLPESYDDFRDKNQHQYISPEPGEENELHVQGHILGTVTHRSQYYHICDVGMKMRTERGRCRQIYLDQFSTDTYTPTGEKVDTAWAMSLYGGELHTSFEEKGTTPERYGEFLVDMLDVMALPHSTPEENKVREEQLMPYRRYGLTRSWLETLQQRYCERRWLVTDTGFIGLGNWQVEDGDVVAELWGLDGSCILRPVAGEAAEGRPKAYRFVGEAYCHGAIQAVEKLEKDDEGRSKGIDIVLV